MKQPNLGYADVKLVFACMHPAGCGRRISLCDYYNLCGCYQEGKYTILPLRSTQSVSGAIEKPPASERGWVVVDGRQPGNYERFWHGLQSLSC